MKRLVCILLALLCLSSCAQAASEETMRAMVARLPDGGILLVRMDGAPEPFSAKLPEQMLDENGGVIAPDALNSGDVVEITGDGALAESWPLQYPGVTAARVLSRGAADDLAPYCEVLEGLLPEKTARDAPPQLTLTWECGVTQASMGNTHWQRDNGDGTTSAVIACGPHVLMWSPIAQLKDARTVALDFAQPVPDQVRTQRWPDALYRAEELPGDGESIPVTKDESGALSIQVEPGYVYLLRASWEEGSAEYGFLTLKPERKEVAQIEEITSEFESNGFTVASESAEPQILTGKRHLLTLGGASDGIVTIYEYEDPTSAQADAQCIDGSGSIVTLDEVTHYVEWKDVPHFYRQNDLILQYVGTDETILNLLTELYGEPFAGGASKR